MKKNELPRPPDRPELSNTPIKLCHEISRLCRTRLRESGDSEAVFAQHGAHMTLAYLAMQDGVTQRELVRATHLRAPTVSVMLRRFEEAGIVERRPDEKDQRAMRVYLTEKGRELDRRNIARIQRMDAEALRVLSEEECEELMRLLLRVRDGFLQTAAENREENEGRDL